STTGRPGCPPRCSGTISGAWYWSTTRPARGSCRCAPARWTPPATRSTRQSSGRTGPREPVRYVIYLDGGTPAEALRQALHSVYGVPPSAVHLGRSGPDPIAVIAPAGGQFSHELRAGDRLADLTRATQLEIAQALCRA